LTRHIVSLVMAVLAAAGPVDVFASAVPPHTLTLHHAELVENTNNIVLAKVVGGGDSASFSWAGERQRAKFETVEILKGNAPKMFSLPNGILGLENEQDARDFGGHRDAVFWDKHVTRQWNAPDCRMYPMFFQDRTYLIFLDHPHWRAYEEIRAEDDLWLAAVRRLLTDPSLESGMSLTLKEWLGLSQGIFVGRIESCKGPTLSVDEVLHGQFASSWRYSDEEDDGYWPGGKCGIGRQYLIVSYQTEPAILPYYSSSMFVIRDDTIDFADALSDSEINIQGNSVKSLDQLREYFAPTSE